MRKFYFELDNRISSITYSNLEKKYILITRNDEGYISIRKRFDTYDDAYNSMQKACNNTAVEVK